MSTYSEDRLKEDALRFLRSRYGKHVVDILQQKALAYLSNASSPVATDPKSDLARFNTVKEVLQLLHEQLDDDTPLLSL